MRPVQQVVVDSGYESEEVDWDAFRSAPGMVGYVVQEKETLWDIAKRYHTKTNYIEDLNNLDGEPSEGKQLLIPKS